MNQVSESTIGDVIRSLNARAPLGAAEEWDNVGLLVGDPATKTQGAVVSIDLTEEAIEMAIQSKFHLIVNHHPCLFPKGGGLGKITQGNLVYEAIRNGISVAAYHTNFDQCSLEVVDVVSQGLGIKPLGRLLDHPKQSLLKLVVYVPEAHSHAVRSALFDAGAGHVGNYSHCSFGTPGEGTFQGNDQTQPFIGKPGNLEYSKEIRLETVFPKGLQESVMSALRKSHPYEEIAYDLYSILQPPAPGGLVRGLGYGFWGEFPSKRPFSDVIKDVRSLFNLHGFWITNPVPSTVTRVGFVAGKGASFVDAAAALNCDLFITGEVGYHNALSSLRKGVTVIELGHRESEKFYVETMKNWLLNLGLQVVEAQTPTQTIWSGGTK